MLPSDCTMIGRSFDIVRNVTDTRTDARLTSIVRDKNASSRPTTSNKNSFRVISATKQRFSIWFGKLRSSSYGDKRIWLIFAIYLLSNVYACLSIRERRKKWISACTERLENNSFVTSISRKMFRHLRS